MKNAIAVGAALLQWLLSGMLLLPTLGPDLGEDVVLFLVPGLLFLASGIYMFVRAPRPGEPSRLWQMLVVFFSPYLVLSVTLPFILTIVAR